MKVTDLFINKPDETELSLTRHAEGAGSPCAMVLNEEHGLKLYRDDKLLHSFVCSPAELGELALGWLHSEGYCADSVEISADGHTARAAGGNDAPTAAQRLSSPAPSASTEEMLELFSRASDKYARSHGIHECVLKGEDWYILRTDIGRHNAIDKAVGAALMKGYDLSKAVMFSSGRINEQTVRKAVRCGIPFVMSKAVITRQALELAEELNLKVLFSVKHTSFMSR